MNDASLLWQAGIEIPDDLPSIRQSHADDVLDAAVAAWSATRLAAGEGRSLPADQTDGPGDVIWY